MTVAEINNILSQLNASASLSVQEYRVSDYHTGKNVDHYCSTLILLSSIYERETETQKVSLWTSKVISAYICSLVLQVENICQYLYFF